MRSKFCGKQSNFFEGFQKNVKLLATLVMTLPTLAAEHSVWYAPIINSKME